MMLKKILIKNKRLKPDEEKKELAEYLKGNLQFEDEEGEDTAAAPPPPEAEGKAAAPAYSGSTTVVHPYLSSFVNYTHPQKFQGFEAAEKQNMHFKMSSFAEPAALGYMKNNSIDFVNFNKRQNSRIYPKGARVDSSNMMPQVFWNAGCQLVCMNCQTADLPMQLNQGKFEYNGNCGYQLKPEFMRMNDKVFDPFSETPVDGVIACELSVRVISGQFICEKRTGSFVECDMFGLPTDTVRKEFRTKVVAANGLNPVYNEDPFKFRKIVMPELAVIRLAVYDNSGDKQLGMRILPFNDMQNGYRHIALKTEGNYPMSLPMIFVQFEIKIYVPDGLGDFMDALCDPRAFMSAQEKRAEQMKAMGIEEDAVEEVAAPEAKKDATKAGGLDVKGKPGPGQAKKAEDPKKEDYSSVLKPITVESLRNEKLFQKATKAQYKQLEAMQKKHKKERETMQKNQCTAIEKLAAKKTDHHKDTDMIAMVKDQTTAWHELVTRQKKEEWEMLKTHMKGQEEQFKTICASVQAQQLKDLEAYFIKEGKDMTANQAKVGMETAKEVNNDPELKTKQDKERRLKEKTANNAKKFLQERKDLPKNQNRAREKAKKKHETELKGIAGQINDTIAMYETQEAEIEMSRRQEAYV